MIARAAELGAIARQAVVLAEHALRLTADRADRTVRLLALGDHLNVGGNRCA